jgi:pSer/pThr/pTyr-binding forkhead associated (FHA) protein
MSYLEIGGRRHPVPMGEAAIACDSAKQILIGDVGQESPSAVLQGLPGGQVAIRRANPEDEILINGVRLGPQPTPLLHGDKIEIAGQELLFVDDRRSGSTQFIQAMDPDAGPEGLKAKGKGAAATSGTGGRLVSLTDGREYEIAEGSVLIGREAGCDVVISSKNVSRRHAEIVSTPKGYLVIDSSTNGTFVNGEKIKGQRVLSRADVIRCGDYEFRFYADARRSQPQAPVPAGPPTPAPGAQQRLQHTLHGFPAQPRPAAAEPAVPKAPVEPTRPREPAAPPGASFQLSDTMHGIPPEEKPPRPPSAEPPPTEPPPAPGAGQRLQDTLLGIPLTPKPGGAQPLSREADRSHLPSRPAQPPEAHEKKDEDLPAKTSEPEALDPGPYPRTGEAEVMESPASGERAAPHPLAVLTVRSGELKGRHFSIKVPVVNIGRADYNDIVIPDESVSTAHAKLQLREGVWVLVDQQSTNGSFVDGLRVADEMPLAPGALVRFGSVQTVFEPTDDSEDLHEGSATKVLQSLRMPPPADPRRSGPPSTES